MSINISNAGKENGLKNDRDDNRQIFICIIDVRDNTFTCLLQDLLIKIIIFNNEGDHTSARW
jgi:hypothetical protein